MLEAIREFGQDGAVLLIGIALGAAWVATIAASNISYDQLDTADADRHVRELLKATSDPIAVILLLSGALAILGGALVAGLTALLSAFGFFTNRWTLAEPDRADESDRAAAPKKTQRAFAVSLTLVFTAVAAIAAAMLLFGV
ncbi:MAG: hypothetical protein AAGA72_15080 [Pseudomonadota bacterium]